MTLSEKEKALIILEESKNAFNECQKQLNDLDLLQYQFKSNELKEFIKENLEVVEIGSSEDIRFYLSLKKRESIE